MPKKRQPVHLICWKNDRAAELTTELERSGFVVDTGDFSQSTLKDLSVDPPDVVVIDLGRLPAQGRDVGVSIRTRAGTRHLPLVFVDGAKEKVA
jgi:DNA-binding response OmpR family regulator